VFVLIQSMSDKGNKVNMHDLKNIIHEMLKFSFRNTSTNISIIYHNLNHKNHINQHPQSHYIQHGLFPLGKKYKENLMILSSKIRTIKVVLLNYELVINDECLLNKWKKSSIIFS
jgi:hypothetical protein